MITFRACFWEWSGEQCIKIAIIDKHVNVFIFNTITQDIKSVHDSSYLFDEKHTKLLLKCVQHFVNNYDLAHDVWSADITIKV